MGNDNSSSNIIPLRRRGEEDADHDHQVINIENVSDFMVDMLDMLKRMATKKDQQMLVYFLDMARIEASEMKNPEDQGGAKN